MDQNKPVMWPTTNPVVIILALPITLFLILFGIWGIVALKSHLTTEASAAHQAAIDKYQGQVVLVTDSVTGVTEGKRGNFMAKKSAAYANFAGTASGVRCLLPDDQHEVIRALPGYPRPHLQLKGVVQSFEAKHLRVRLEGCHLQ